MHHSFLYETLRWLAWQMVTHFDHDIRDSLLRFNALFDPDSLEDIFRGYAVGAHIPGTAAYRMAKSGITLHPSDFNPS